MRTDPAPSLPRQRAQARRDRRRGAAARSACRPRQLPRVVGRPEYPVVGIPGTRFRVFVLPRTTAPAARSRSTTGASSSGIQS